MAAMSAPSWHLTLRTLPLGIVVWLCDISVASETHVTIDSHGYILYCPCMGRFGNQADTLLGMLSFSKGLDRTLVLPHWVEYRSFGKKGNSTQVPFDKYFEVKPLEKYVKVITMTTFMKDLAPTIWPPSARQVTCFGPRSGLKENDCNVKDGVPSTPFWDTFNIDFVRSEFYDYIITSLTDYNLQIASVASKWMNRFPPRKYPVIAFIGAPVFMPVNPKNNPLQRLLVWSDSVRAQAEGFVRNNIPFKPFLGIHVRHSQEWAMFCQNHVKWTEQQYYLAYQCLGDNYRDSRVPLHVCEPPDDLVMKQVETTLKQMKASSLFVATDDRQMVTKLTQYLKKMKVSVVRLDSLSPHVDLAVLAMADHFIGNCVSTFTGFAVRQRNINKKTFSFWLFNDVAKHDKL